MENEHALTIILSSLQIDTLKRRRIEHFIKHKVNWFEVFQISIREKTVFLVYKNLLEQHYLFFLPANLRVVWERAYQGNIQHNQFLLLKASEIENSFIQNKINVCPVRGIIILRLFPECVSWRILRDVDFLVDTDSIDKANEVMQREGFAKLYINDQDFLLCNKNSFKESILFEKKYKDLGVFNCDLCWDIKPSEQYERILLALAEKGSEKYFVSHCILFYLSAIDTANKEANKHLGSGIEYSLAKLLDIQLLENLCQNKAIRYSLDKEIKTFQIENQVNEIRKLVAHYWEGDETV